MPSTSKENTQSNEAPKQGSTPTLGKLTLCHCCFPAMGKCNYPAQLLFSQGNVNLWQNRNMVLRVLSIHLILLDWCLSEVLGRKAEPLLYCPAQISPTVLLHTELLGLPTSPHLLGELSVMADLRVLPHHRLLIHLFLLLLTEGQSYRNDQIHHICLSKSLL